MLAATELGDALHNATQGRAGRDALMAAAQAMRTYVKDHPGRYAAGNAVPPTRADDPLTPAINRMFDSISAVLARYQLDPAQEIHALRMLRRMRHGFATLEEEGGLRLDTDVNDSFAWMVDLIDRGLQFAQSSSDLPVSVTDASVPSPSLTGAR